MSVCVFGGGDGGLEEELGGGGGLDGVRRYSDRGVVRLVI